MPLQVSEINEDGIGDRVPSRLVWLQIILVNKIFPRLSSSRMSRCRVLGGPESGPDPVQSWKNTDVGRVALAGLLESSAVNDQAASLNHRMSMRKRIVVQGGMLASFSRGPESIPWSAMLRSPMRGCFCSLGIKFKRVFSKKDTGSQNIRGKNPANVVTASFTHLNLNFLVR